MDYLLNFEAVRRFAAPIFVVATVLSLSSCAGLTDFYSEIMEEETTAELEAKEETAKEELAEAKEADKKAQEEEAQEMKFEKKEEKKEDKEFAEMQDQLKKDLAEAAANPDQSQEVSRVFFDREILSVNQRIHAVSQRVEHLSGRVHKLAEHVESLPEKLAALKLELVETEEKVQKNTETAAKAPTSLAKAPRTLTGAATKSFWGVQVGAYSTKAAAQKGWAEILAEGAALELNDAEVRYIVSKPRKDGRKLSLIVINEYPGRNAAFLACKGLRGQGVDCVPIHVKP